MDRRDQICECLINEDALSVMKDCNFWQKVSIYRDSAPSVLMVSMLCDALFYIADNHVHFFNNNEYNIRGLNDFINFATGLLNECSKNPTATAHFTVHKKGGVQP